MKLIIEDDEGRKTVVPFVREEITIGRQEGNTIRLTERNVSRRHARLMRLNGHVVVEDLGSSNGTRINGERISGQSTVKDGDLIQIGDYDLALQSDAQEAVPTQRLRPSSAEEVPEDEEADDPTGEPETEAESPVGEHVAEASAAQGPGDQRRHSTAIIKMEQVEGNRARKVLELEAEEAPRLVVTNTELKGQEYACIRTEMKIGRTDDNDIVIDHRSLSRTHAKIVREDNGEWRILDMQSANGLTVNGETYAQASLSHGDIIELGHVKLRFLLAGEALGVSSLGGRSKPVLVLALVALLVVGGAAAFFLLTPGSGTPPPVDPIAQPDPGTKQPELAQPSPPEPSPEQPRPDSATEAARQLEERLQLAQKEFSEGNLDKAWDTLEPARNTDGSWPREAQPLATQLENERQARKAIAAARLAYEQKKYEEALAQLKPAHGSKLFQAEHDQVLKDIEVAQAPPKPEQGKPPQGKPPPQSNTQDEAKSALANATKLLKAKQYVEARAEANRCITLTPDNPECQLVMGVAFANENAWEKATPYYKRFLELAPDHKLAPKIRESLKQLGK